MWSSKSCLFPWIKMFPVEMQHLNYVNYIFLPSMLHCKLRDIMLLLFGDMFFGWVRCSFYILETSPFKTWLHLITLSYIVKKQYNTYKSQFMTNRTPDNNNNLQWLIFTIWYNVMFLIGWWGQEVKQRSIFVHTAQSLQNFIHLSLYKS